jgi:hypothetical protein
MNYHRIIPRDLFNEAKLLKCLGQLSLFIHEGMDNSHNKVPAALQMEYDSRHDNLGNEVGFVVKQNEHDGSIFVTNISLLYHGAEVYLSSPLNSRDNYPLQFNCPEGGGCDGRVFDDGGNFSDDFVNFLIDYAKEDY